MHNTLLNKIKNYAGVKVYGITSKVSEKRKQKEIQAFNQEVSGIIAQYKYVHIIFNDKFCDPFIRFINEKFNTQEHVFLVFRTHEQFPFPKVENVIEIQSLFGIDFSASTIKTVVMHSLFIPEGVKYWNEHRSVQQQKVYWMMWGGDLYDAPRNEEEDAVRRNFKGYISDTDGDCEIVRQKYSLENKIYIDAAYTFPITMQMVDEAIRCKKEHDYIQIQINNSADATTIEMLETLGKYADQNIKVVTVLSYGHLQYKDQIIETGKRIFGSKFEYLDQYLTPGEYAKWLAGNDLYILNQHRQEGLGNSFASLAEGAKLFIRSTVTTYHHFNNKDIKVFDTLDIKNMSFEELIEYGNTLKEKNMKNVRFFFDNEYLKEKWEKVFMGE